MEYRVHNANASMSHELTIDELDAIHGGASVTAVVIAAIVIAGLSAAHVALSTAIAVSKATGT